MNTVNINKNLSVAYGEHLAVGYEVATLPDSTVTVDYQVMPVIEFDDGCYAIKFGNLMGQFYAPDANIGAEEIQHLLARNERHIDCNQRGWDGIVEYQSRYHGIPQGVFNLVMVHGINHVSSPCSYDEASTKGVYLLGVNNPFTEVSTASECMVKVSTMCSDDEHSLIPAIKLCEKKYKL